MYKVEILEKDCESSSFLYDRKKSLLEAFRIQRLQGAPIKSTTHIQYACKVGGCGLCKIKVVQGDFRMGTYSTKVLPSHELSQNITLACKTFLESDSKIEILE